MRRLCPVTLVMCVLLSFGHCDLSAQEDHESSAQGTVLQIQQLYRVAHEAMQAGEYIYAIQTYHDILALDAEKLLEPRSFCDIQWRLATAHARLEHYNEAQALVAQLRQRPLPGHLFLRTELLGARLDRDQGNTEKAYRTLLSLGEAIATYEWSPEDRTLLAELEQALNEKFEAQLLQAEQLFDGAALAEAIPLYESVLTAISSKSYPDACQESGEDIEVKVRYRLAQAHYLLENYKNVIAVLDQTVPSSLDEHVKLHEVYRSASYLKGLAYRHTGAHAEAIGQFQTYLSMGDRATLSHYSETQWHMGYCFYKMGKFAKARLYLEAMPTTEKNPRLYFLAQVTLAYMELQEGTLDSVESILQPLALQLPEDDALRYEIAYIRGEAHYRLGDYSQAARYLEEAIPERNRNKATWYPTTLYNLSWSYLKIADTQESEPATQEKYFSLAESTLKKLITIDQDEKLYLALAKVYLARGHRLRDRKAFEQVESLLGQTNTFQNIQHEAEALLLRAEAAGSYTERTALYKQLTEADIYRGTVAYAYGWYYRGIHEFEEAKKRQHSSIDDGNPVVTFQQALQSLDTAYSMLRGISPAKAGLAIKFQAEACFNLNTEEDLVAGLSLCDRLIHDEPAVFDAMEEPDEVFYLRGLIASRLISREDGESFEKLAQESLQEVITSFPRGQFVTNALNLLGTMAFNKQEYDKAERLFLQIATQHPQSPLAGEAWFWASECADWQHKDPESVKEFRRKAFEQYPDSAHADEAYFNYYTYGEYLQGSHGAIQHLEEMKEKYPDSPLLIVAHYLIGLEEKRERKNGAGQVVHEQDLNAANEQFAKAVKTFDFCLEAGLIRESSLEYFLTVRYRALLEGAAVNLQIAESSNGAKRQIYLEYAESGYKGVIRNFEQEDHPLASYLARGEPYPRCLEEAQYGLIRTHLLANKDQQAEEVLADMLERYRKADIKRGYFLSRIWYEQGRIAFRRNDLQLAFSCFNHAEEAAQGRVLSTEERLDLWIKQSYCLRELQRYDEAMLMLSKVINEDAASSLRIKAMYLRAELYELQDRSDLAVKQLEATANKPGKWAIKAQEKLVKDYGYN